VLGHASSTPLCLAPLLRREHRGVGRRRRYQHCREAIVFQVEFLVGVSELIDRGAALGHQELEAADLVLVAFHGGAQTHDRNLQFGASAQGRFHPAQFLEGFGARRGAIFHGEAAEPVRGS